MEQTSMENGFGIYVYCFMPDHLHLLLLGQETSSLPKFMKTFKQRSSYILKNTLGGVLWQRSYYDHVLRKEEVLRDVAMYVLNNPVRARLVDNYLDYPFSGSAMFYIKDIDGQT
jgi:putative transposase